MSWPRKAISRRTKNKPAKDFEIDPKGLECPVCFETVKSTPIYQCINKHLVCNTCIPKLKKCPICRNDSPPVRSRKLEKIVRILEGIGRINGEIKDLDWDRGSNHLHQDSTHEEFAIPIHQSHHLQGDA